MVAVSVGRSIVARTQVAVGPVVRGGVGVDFRCGLVIGPRVDYRLLVLDGWSGGDDPRGVDDRLGIRTPITDTSRAFQVRDRRIRRTVGPPVLHGRRQDSRSVGVAGRRLGVCEIRYAGNGACCDKYG